MWDGHAGDFCEKIVVLRFECLTHGRALNDRSGVYFVFGGLCHHAPGNAAVVDVVVVVGEFVGDPQTDDEGDGHTGGKTGDIDERGGPVLHEIAPGDADIVFEHRLQLCEKKRPKRCRSDSVLIISELSYAVGGRVFGFDTESVRDGAKKRSIKSISVFATCVVRTY